MIRLYLLILAALLIRLAIIPMPGFKIDVDAWDAWASRGYELGFSNFYSDQVWTNYTPGYIYILFTLETIRRLLSLSAETFYILLKIPPIIAEIALVIYVFKILKEKSSIPISIMAAALISFNPAFIFNSAVWGQIDGFLTLFMVLSIYYLTKNQPLLSSITFSLALLIKPQSIFLIPLYIFYIVVKRFNLNSVLRLIFPGFFLALTASLPFFPNKPFTGIFELIVKMSNDYSSTSLFAYNLWGIVGFWIPDNNLWSIFTYRNWGYILLASYWVLIAYFYFKKKLSFYSLAALATLSFYFLPTRVHERYLYPAIPFLILSASLAKSKPLLLLTGILSLIHLFNLYYVYVYYNEFYLNLPKLLYSPILYNFLDSNGRLMSIISTLVFILISIIIFRNSYVHQKNK